MNYDFGWFLQVPYYLGEMTQQIEHEDRPQVVAGSSQGT
jgi:hypothetical protein